ncbi:unnamed protein product [Chrysoparadoxa australica]
MAAGAPYTCKATLQSLPQLAKQYVMRLLCLTDGIGKDVVQSWVLDDYKRVHKASLRRLRKLQILVPHESEKGKLRLNPPFRENLQYALVHADKQPWRDNVNIKPLKPDKHPPSLQRIEQDMHSKWERVLYLLVGSDPAQTGVPDPPDSVIDFISQAGLMKRDKRGQLSITDLGYEFMLKDIHEQAWMFVLTLIKAYSNDPLARDELLAFLFQLSYTKVSLQPSSFHHPAQAIPEETHCNGDIIAGLLYQRKASSSRFYTTSVAVNLIFGAASKTPSRAMVQALNVQESGGRGFARMAVIVETNYQVIAYTSSDLHVAMLSLFVELKARVPNMVMGTITRESIRKALLTGIKARQILNFLQWHPHPVVASRVPIVPENIADQIILWERERDRVRYKDGVLLDLSTASRDQFEDVATHALEQGGTLWSDYDRKVIVLSPQEAEQIKGFAAALIGSC